MTKELTIVDQAKKLIINNKLAFEAVLSKNFDVQKFIATFCLEVQKNEKLAQCSNLIEVARDVANFGLIIGGLANQAYLIPYNKKVQENGKWITQTTAQLIIGYKGYITKLEEAGYSVECELVTYEELNQNRFQEIRGTNPQILHSPIRTGVRNKESIALAYCVLTKDGKSTFAVLSKEEIEEMSKTEKWIGEGKEKTKTRQLGNVWQSKERSTDYGQMCLKAVIRNAVKRVNLSIANEMSTYEGQRDKKIQEKPAKEPIIINDLPPAEEVKDDIIVEEPQIEEQKQVVVEVKQKKEKVVNQLSDEEIEAINKKEAEDLKNNEYKRAKDGE